MAAATLAVAGLLGAQPASAACSVKALAIPVKMEGLRPLVTLKVEGQEGRFLLDSGSHINAISSKMAADRKLRPMTIGHGGAGINDSTETSISGANGRLNVNYMVVASQVEFVGTVFKNVAFMATRDLEEDGLIGQSTLHQFDVEYDLRGGVVRLVQPEDCGNADIVYWAKAGAAISKIPLNRTVKVQDRIVADNLHTRGTVFINGVQMRALFDTGASFTFITERAAERAGVRTSDPGVQSARDFNGLDGRGKAWIGGFKSVKIGDEEIQNTTLEIGQSATDDFDVLIGADFFLSHHVYVANSQNRIYFSYLGGSPFLTPRPQPAAAPTAQK
jgi:predicted aspartyl protease